MMNYISFSIVSAKSTIRFWDVLSQFLPLFTGVALSLFSSYVQKKRDEKSFRVKREFEQRCNLLKAYEQLQDELLGVITRLSDIKKFIPKVTPTNHYDFFSSIDLAAVSTNEVLQLLKQTINSINFNSISQSAKDIMTKIYCEKIITDASFVLDPECIPLIFKRFSKLAVGPARELQGIDHSEYEELVNFAMEFCKTNFSKASIWVLQNMAVRNAKGCEKRLENMIKGSKNG